MTKHPTVIAGRKPLLEALRAGTPLAKIILRQGLHGAPVDSIRSLAKEKGVKVEEADPKRFRELGGEEASQGVLGLLGETKTVELEDILRIAHQRGEPPLLIVLDEIEDPHNVGALLRTAECAGVHGAILLKHHSPPLASTIAKTSAGASFHLPIARVANLAQTIGELKQQGIWVVGTDASAEKTFYEFDYAGPTAIVIGSEGKGMRRLVKEMCDVLLKIPLFGKIESLNASVAGGLVMFEAARARHRDLR
jgi:23S rRNA (guanosine2251-2'-O)-methyltransferase